MTDPVASDGTAWSSWAPSPAALATYRWLVVTSRAFGHSTDLHRPQRILVRFRFKTVFFTYLH